MRNKKNCILKLHHILDKIYLKNFCCIISLRQGTLLIAIIELSLTSFMLFLLLLGITHVQDIIETVEDDLEQLEESNWVVGQLQGLSVYFNNNEQKMLSGQNLASLMMVLVYTGLIVTCIHFISCVLLLYGAIRNIPQFLLPWTLTVLFSIIIGCSFLFILIFVPLQGCNIGFHVSGAFLLTIELYAWLVVFSYYRELKTQEWRFIKNQTT
ncbi:conserved hypothetical protein [Pediculus humanus corporis]|uniref:Uncharacterized protein n=1 Tax=Pediculus humanus subsp. corporis TaxID=121224 RepID=E0VCR0_PEDHC|nr:uncharacterized protein Phum_PHUM094840 [Pediculus humanus corporis]EEB11166.1 conserved hypothetical protein [Pediculus humanus corporis]